MSRRIRSARALLLLACSALLVSVPAFAEDPVSVKELAAGITRLRDAIGPYRAEYDLAIMAMDATGRAGYKLFPLVSNFWTLTDGVRFKTRYEYQVFYYLTDSSPVEIRTNEADTTFDGVYYSESNSHYSGRITQSAPDEPLPNPISIWLQLHEHTFEELLQGDNVQDMGEQQFGDTLCRVFEFPHPYIDDRICQLWLQRDGDFTIPHRIATQFRAKNGKFEDSSAVELVELYRTPAGVPYPKVLTRRLYMGLDGKTVCFDDQTFKCKEFTAPISVSDSDFVVQRPPSAD